MSFTVTCNVTVVLPAVLLAETKYAPTGESKVGVPLITPLDGFSARPEGKAGEMLKYRFVPLAAGTLGAIEVPLT
jgi:hypothetical protein